ncbi:MAG: metal ABC transporter substrate-binding protein [Candidatus Nanopelagicales bacterium]
MSLTARKAAAVVLAVATAVALGACAADGEAASDGAGNGTLDVVASFYPLAYLVEQVGGERVSVSSLTKPGAEPHDLELTATDVASVADADLVVYLSEFQPAVDEAVAAEAADQAWDAAAYADLSLKIEGGEGNTVDPHFWLDPQRYLDVSDALADALAEVDTAGADAFTANAARLRAELEALDDEWASGTASCESRDLVTSHTAFGYLADRYDFTQLGIAGLTPEAEPTPEALAAAADFVRDHSVRTIYFETLVSPAIAETVAAEAGADTAMLDPLEGLTDESAGGDYLEVMRTNLETVRRGQACT